MNPAEITPRHPNPSAGRWRGHLPDASSVLAPLLERAATGNCAFSAPERALFMACEFWCAVETRGLPQHLGADPADGLRNQVLVYAAIGAQGVSRSLVAALRDLSASQGPAARARSLDVLQERLGNSPDPVDMLIAQLAGRLGIGVAPAPAQPASISAIRMLA